MQRWVLVLVLLLGSRAAYSLEIAQFVGAQKNGASIPVPQAKIGISGSAYQLSTAYQLGNRELFTFLGKACNCEVNGGSLSSHSFYRVRVAPLDPTASPADETVRGAVFSGPLGLLGPGRLTPTDHLIVFQTQASGTVTTSVLAITEQGTLWDAAISQIRRNGLTLTPDAAVALDREVRGAEELSPGATDYQAAEGTRSFVNEIISSATRSGKTVIDANDVNATASVWCVYPFCRKNK